MTIRTKNTSISYYSNSDHGVDLFFVDKMILVCRHRNITTNMNTKLKSTTSDGPLVARASRTPCNDMCTATALHTSTAPPTKHPKNTNRVSINPWQRLVHSHLYNIPSLTARNSKYLFSKYNKINTIAGLKALQSASIGDNRRFGSRRLYCTRGHKATRTPSHPLTVVP